MKTESDLIIESIIREIEYGQFDESMNANYYNDSIDREDMTLAGHQWPEVDRDRYPRATSLSWYDLDKILSKGAYHTITYAPYHTDRKRSVVDKTRDKDDYYIDLKGKKRRHTITQYWYALPGEAPAWHNTARREMDVSYQRDDFDAEDPTYTYYVTRNWKQFQENPDIAAATEWKAPSGASPSETEGSAYIMVWKFGTKSEADIMANKDSETSEFVSDHKKHWVGARHQQDKEYTTNKGNSYYVADFSKGKGGRYGSDIDDKSGVPWGLKSGFRSLLISRIVAIDGKPIH